MIRHFDIADVNQSASSFNPEKMLWINQQHIIATPAGALAAELMPFLVRAGLDPSDGPDAEQVAEAYHERAETLVHMAANARYCYEDFENFEPMSAKKHLRPVVLDAMRTVRTRLAELEHWGQGAIIEVVRAVAEDYDLNIGKLGQPMRVAVTGGPVSPSIDTTLWLVGQRRTLERLDKAIEFIEDRARQAG